ncbi:MAG: CPXCG motif-containing cysteine-rich protein [Fibrobacterota bacterium]
MKENGIGKESDYFCPYCGQKTSVFVDPSSGREQSFPGECGVCGREIEINITINDSGASVKADRPA